jgi:hypothetical protein
VRGSDTGATTIGTEAALALLGAAALGGWIAWANERQKCKWLQAFLDRSDNRFDRLTEELPKQLSPWVRAAEAQSSVVRPSAPEARAQVLPADAVRKFVEKYREEGYRDEEIQKMLLEIDEQMMGVGFP